MSATKTQGSFPSDDSAQRRRHAAPGSPADPGATVPAATGPTGDALGGLPDTLAAAGRLAGRIIEAVAGSGSPVPRPVTGRATDTAAGRVRPQTTGVIFVHGIGSQLPGDTLLQWSAPLIEIITAWKSWAAPASIVRDPVDLAHIDFKNDQPTIDLAIPEVTVGGRTFPANRWILTESWWAAKVAPPSLSTMTSWLGPQNGASQIVDAILGNRTDGARGLRWARAFVVPFVSVLAALILTGYAVVRGLTGLIPIQTVRDAAVLRAFDNFLTGWFGDIRILLFDPAQSANIRAGLAAAVHRFREVEKVDSVVIMAHSGGAMVSYLTLSDPAYADLDVDKLITFGEGWNLAMTLTPNGQGMADRLRRDVTAIHPMLRWRDFWGSHDPAPAGEVRSHEIVGGAVAEDHIRSRQVWNRRSLLDDHGSYFENDEEFTIAVLREIDNPTGWGETPDGAPPVSRFYPTPPANATPTLPPADPRERRHRERVAILALWRQLSIAVPIAVITTVLASPSRLSDLGTKALDVLKSIPLVKDLVTGPIDWLLGLKIVVPDVAFGPFGAFGTVNLTGAIDLLGLATLQAIVLISIVQLLWAPVEAYQAWPDGSARRWLFLGVEIAIDVGLIVAFAWLMRADPHEPKLLGAGWVTWLPGIFLTFLTGAVAYLGSLFARVAPAVTRLYAIVAGSLFLAAMVAAVVVIFLREDLRQGEVGYAVIWLSFIVLYRLGHDRWAQWDRVERRAAYTESPTTTVSRRPVWLSMAGFLLVAAGVVSALLAWGDGLTAVLAGGGGGLVVLSVAAGSVAWGGAGNQIASPSAVESARGKV